MVLNPCSAQKQGFDDNVISFNPTLVGLTTDIFESRGTFLVNLHTELRAIAETSITDPVIVGVDIGLKGSTDYNNNQYVDGAPYIFTESILEANKTTDLSDPTLVTSRSQYLLKNKSESATKIMNFDAGQEIYLECRWKFVYPESSPGIIDTGVTGLAIEVNKVTLTLYKIDDPVATRSPVKPKLCVVECDDC